MQSVAATKERRKHYRHACTLSISCHPYVNRGDETWVGQLMDISRGGLRVEVTRRFERGTILNILIKDAPPEAPDSLLARVLYVGAKGDGKWTLGCNFSPELDETEIHAYLGH